LWGGKTPVGKDFAAVLQQILEGDDGDPPIENYVEPFCGAMGVMKHMGEYLDAHGYDAYASDGCGDIIQLWQEVQNNIFRYPGPLSKQEWYQLKDTPSPSAIKAYAGFGFSFSGIYFGNYVEDAYKEDALVKLLYRDAAKFPTNLRLRHCDYQASLEGIDGRCLIYADPPYREGTYAFGSTFGYDHQQFVDQVQRWSDQGHVVVVSETSFPLGRPVYEKTRFVQNKTNTKQTLTQYLYLI
jgi:site-specific DNA-adenine methylase